MNHDCKGHIYQSGCIDCAVRLLLGTKGKQEEVMLAYLSFYHGHKKDELTFRLGKARRPDRGTSA